MSKKRSLLKRGNSAMNTLKREQEAADARREAARSQGPFRFWVAKEGRGYQEHEVVVLDDNALECPFAHEHSVPGPGMDFSKTRHHICVDEVDNCALCRAQEAGLGDEFKHPQYNMYVSILDLTPFEVKSGPRAGEVIEATRKLLVVPHGSVATFQRIFELAMKNEGTTRGLTMVLTKEKQMDPRCGSPIMLDNGMLFDMMDEDELDDFSNDEVKRDGKVVKEEGEDIEPYEYEDILVADDAKLLKKLYDLPSTIVPDDEEEEGSRSSRRRRRGKSSDEEDTGDKAPKRRSRRSARDEEEDEEPPKRNRRSRRSTRDEDEEEEEPPKRSRRSRRSARDEEEDEPPAPSRRRNRKPEPDLEGEDDEPEGGYVEDEDDVPPPPRTTRSRRRKKAEDDDLPFGED